MERAISKEAILETARTLHDLYLAQKFICDRTNRYYLRPWHLTPAAAIYTAKHTGPQGVEIAGSCTMIDDTLAVGLPADRFYPDELQFLRNRGAFLSEASCFAVSPRYRRTAATTELMRAAFAHALCRENTHILCIVSTNQRGFYGHLGFSQVGPCKNYSTSRLDPVVLMVADLEELFGPAPLSGTGEAAGEAERYWTEDNPYVELIRSWMDQAAETMRDPSLLQSLHKACPEVFDELEGADRLSFIRAGTALFEGPVQSSSKPALAS